MAENIHHSHLQQHSSMKSEYQMPTQLPSPVWTDCDTNLSTYSPLFDGASPSASKNRFASTVETEGRWDFFNTIPGGLFPEPPSYSSPTIRYINPANFSPATPNSDIFQSEFNSPRTLNGLDTNGASSTGPYCWNTGVQSPILEPPSMIKATSIKPRWSSCQPRKSSPESHSTTRSKRLKPSSPTLSTKPSLKVSKPRKPTTPTTATSFPSPPKARKEHNLIEKKYRSKLNEQFEVLLASLPPELIAEVNEARIAARQPEKAISKAEVLALAKERIEMLERERDGLVVQRSVLRGEVEAWRGRWKGVGEGGGDEGAR